MPLRKTVSILGAALAAVATTAVGGPADGATSDPLRSQQWGLDQVHAEAAWAASTGSGVVVAGGDTGVDLNHPDLQGRLARGVTTVDCGPRQTYCGNGSWVGMDGVAQPADSHGTHVSGIVAAAAGNGIGVAGVAPDAHVMPIKSLEDGSGSFEDIAAGIRYAADHGADVVNLSLGAVPGAQALTITGLESSVTDAIAYATSQGVLVVAAAGNESFPVCDTPSFEPGALCVTATTRDETPAWYSNGAVKPDLDAVAAPGGAGLVFCEDDIVSTVPVGTGSKTCGQHDYDYYAGTSMATPHVAGLAALLYAQGRNRANVHDALVATARTPGLGTGVFTTGYGHGIVDARAAVAYPVTTAGAAPKSGKKK